MSAKKDVLIGAILVLASALAVIAFFIWLFSKF